MFDSFWGKTFKGLLYGAGAIALAAVSIALMQHKLIYMTRSYKANYPYYSRLNQKMLARGMTKLKYKTDQGDQVAYYIPPFRSSLFSYHSREPRLWLLFGGNAQLAMDWFPMVERYADTLTEYSVVSSFLLIDYPGYGECQGSPSPQTILESTQQAVSALADSKQSTVDKLLMEHRLGVLGHSLGSASALMYSASPGASNTIERIVLLSPFTSMLDMARIFFPLPGLSWLLQHNFNNTEALSSVIQNRAEEGSRKLQLTIIHGQQDEIVPISMGRFLHAHAKRCVDEAAGGSNVAARVELTLRELPSCDHNQITVLGESEIHAALNS